MSSPEAGRQYGHPVLAFFVYSNLFITACAVLMVYQTYDLLLHSTPDLSFTGFVVFATLCSYSFHWWLTPDIDMESSRLRWLKKYRHVHQILFVAGLLGVAWTGILLIRHWPWLLLAAFVTFLYSAPKIPHPLFRVLRKVAVGKTVFLAFVWMYVTTALPLQLSGQAWQKDFTLFAASRFFLIYAICILFDHRDREYDRSIGIRSLITWMNERGIAVLFTVTLLAFGTLTLLLDYHPVIIAVLILPGIVTGIIYRHAIRHSSDLLYYFILDGLMAVSSFITLLPGI